MWENSQAIVTSGVCEAGVSLQSKSLLARPCLKQCTMVAQQTHLYTITWQASTSTRPRTLVRVFMVLASVFAMIMRQMRETSDRLLHWAAATQWCFFSTTAPRFLCYTVVPTPPALVGHPAAPATATEFMIYLIYHSGTLFTPAFPVLTLCLLGAHNVSVQHQHLPLL